jgi:hypothetical protein
MCNKAQRLKVVEKREEKNKTSGAGRRRRLGKGARQKALRTGTSVLDKVGQKRDKGALEKRQANREAEGEGVEGLEKKERRKKKRVKVDEPQWVAWGRR